MPGRVVALVMVAWVMDGDGKATLECVGGVTLPETDAKPISGGEPPPSQPPFEPQAFAPGMSHPWKISARRSRLA